MRGCFADAYVPSDFYRRISRQHAVTDFGNDVSLKGAVNEGTVFRKGQQHGSASAPEGTEAVVDGRFKKRPFTEAAGFQKALECFYILGRIQFYFSSIVIKSASEAPQAD